MVILPIISYRLNFGILDFDLPVLKVLFRAPWSKHTFCCRSLYSSMQCCTICLSCVGRKRPSMPEPYLDVPSAMLPRSMITTSLQPFWTRWYATELPTRPEPAMSTLVRAGSLGSTGMRMMESFDFCVGLPQGETPCDCKEADDAAKFCDAQKALAEAPRLRMCFTGRENIARPRTGRLNTVRFLNG